MCTIVYDITCVYMNEPPSNRLAVNLHYLMCDRVLLCFNIVNFVCVNDTR